MIQDYIKTEQGYTYEYPRAAMTTDSVIFGFDGKGLQILLVQRGIDPFKGSWALPGGFLRMDETIEECAKRELFEETGLAQPYMEQFGIFSDVNRDPRGRIITSAFYALVCIADVKGGDDAADAKWFPITEIPTLAFDHDRIVRVAQQRLREDIHFRPVGFELMAEQFTIPQLQRLYESILGIRFERRNFAKKILATGILDPVGKKAEVRGHRPPELYTFNQDKYEQLKQDHSMRLEF